MANHWVVNVDTKVMIASFDDAGKATCSIGSDHVWLEAPEGVSAGNCKVVVETPAVAAVIGVEGVEAVEAVAEVLDESGAVITPAVVAVAAVAAVAGSMAIPAVLKLVDGAADRQGPVWSALRVERTRRLSLTDWRYRSDVRVMMTQQQKDDWDGYSQALRNVPQDCTIPENPTWPTEPS